MKNSYPIPFPFTRTLLSAAISLALVPAAGHAALKPSDIQGLPQTGTITGIRSGRAGNGDVVLTWRSGDNVHGQRISSTGTLIGNRLDITDDADNDAVLAVKADGSFISVWPTSTSVMGVKATGNGLGDPFTVSDSSTEPPYRIFDRADGFIFAWDATLLEFDDANEPGTEESIDTFSSIAMDNDGDFFLVNADYEGLTVQKNAEDPVAIPANQPVSPYDFDEGKNKHKSVSFEIDDPVIAVNDAGDIVLVWREIKTEETRKKKRFCYTYYGERYCYTDYVYSSSPSTTLVARRYDHSLSAKDPKPLVVASIKGKGAFIKNPTVVMDADGDFTVAYSAGKSTTTYNYDDYGYTTVGQSEVFVRQFANNKKKTKFSAGKTVKVSSKPKLPAGHKLKNSTNQEPSVVITDDKTNSFIILWHNDYEDHYKDPENPVQVCTKWRKYKYDGYTYRECVRYKDVPGDAYDLSSVLKAKRYDNQ